MHLEIFADHSFIPKECKNSIEFNTGVSPKEGCPVVMVKSGFPLQTVLGYFVPEAMGFVPKGSAIKMLKEWR